MSEPIAGPSITGRQISFEPAYFTYSDELARKTKRAKAVPQVSGNSVF